MYVCMYVCIYIIYINRAVIDFIYSELSTLNFEKIHVYLLVFDEHQSRKNENINETVN